MSHLTHPNTNALTRSYASTARDWGVLSIGTKLLPTVVFFFDSKDLSKKIKIFPEIISKLNFQKQLKKNKSIESTFGNFFPKETPRKETINE